ncbi:helix-turn-helix domain-containing protein [Mesorhizobium sp. WSM3224]|uniref:helix-turn-helix domain-containing protein n=1 Tax=Mesorhizobium sp. WSM3224 TaxID=1040986 RepID=UPI000487854C|nr:helix-turn-helix domain-containing protein [Mesorhizobium sp. WSM3224]
MARSEFRTESFYEALDRARLIRRLNWKQVAEASGVSASTLTRLAQGKRPDVDSLASLVSWSGLSADAFVGGRPKPQATEPLSQITSVLYADQSLSEDGRDTMIDMITAAYTRLTKNAK